MNKKVLSWALYDWGNSAFSTTVMAGFFPVFFKEYWSAGIDPLLTTARLGTAISIGSVSIAMTSPILGSLADLRGTKKLFCFLFMLMGALGCIALAFVDKGDWWTACLFYAMAMMGFNASCVFYDSLLPSVATEKGSHYASSLGFSLGYLGGGILFLINILMYMKPEFFGIRDGVQAIQLSFISVGVWWIFFSIPLFKNVPEPKETSSSNLTFSQTLSRTFSQLLQTLKEIRHNKNILFFLLGFWLYIDGVYTVMTMAVDYGLTLGFKPNDLITALLIVQFIGFPFALIFSRIAGRFGAKIPILICVGIYCITVIGATQMTSSTHFYILAAIIGMVQGGVQALSRSLFSDLIPAEKSGEYFGLFNLVGKFASIIGPTLVGWGTLLLGNARYGMLGLLVLLITGGALLTRVREEAP